jgi:hypothetical protein
VHIVDRRSNPAQIAAAASIENGLSVSAAVGSPGFGNCSQNAFTPLRASSSCVSPFAAPLTNAFQIVGHSVVRRPTATEHEPRGRVAVHK